MELNYNWATVDSSANLASWFCHKDRELCLAAAHNHHKTTTRHQPGGTGMVCRHVFLQYARKPFNNFQGLGGWWSWPIYCNPTHSTRIAVAYWTGSSKSKGLCTIYQQQIWYMQLHNITGTPHSSWFNWLLYGILLVYWKIVLFLAARRNVGKSLYKLLLVCFVQ